MPPTARDPAPAGAGRAYAGLLVSNFVTLFLIAGSGVYSAGAMAEFGAEDRLGLAFTLESLARCVVLPLAGPLGDRVGRRGLYLSSVVGYVVATMACALSASAPLFLAGRTLMGITWGLFMANSFALIADLYSAEEGARRTGYAQSVGFVAMIVAAPAVGVCADLVSWRLVFWLSVPLLGAAWGLVFSGLPPSPRSAARPVDVAGRLLKNRGFLQVFALMVLYCVVGAAGNFLPAFAGYTLGTSATVAGLITTPGLIVAAVGATWVGRYLGDRGRYRGVILVWAFVLLAGSGLYATFRPATRLWLVIVAATLLGVCLAASEVVPYALSMLVLRPADVASGVALMTFGGAIATTLGSALYTAVTVNGLEHAFQLTPLFAVAFVAIALAFRDRPADGDAAP
jgi:MFS family permease